MKWWKGMLGLETDAPPNSEGKAIIGAPGSALDQWLNPGVSRQDGNNFRTNMVTLAQYMDNQSQGTLIGLSATYACVSLLAGTVASLPLQVFRPSPGGYNVPAFDHPLYQVLNRSPNFDLSAAEAWEIMAAVLELRGNAYARLSKRNDGSISAFYPILSEVKVERVGRRLRYSWTEEGKNYEVYDTGILHLRGFGGGPLGGKSALSVCRQVFRGALDAETSAVNMFKNGALPSGVLSTDKTMTPEQRKEAEKLLMEKFVGSLNAGTPMLLDNGVKWEQLTISPEDIQMLESRRFSVEEICRIFGVPPHMIGHTEKTSSWGTGLEQQTLGFVKFTLRRRLRKIEQALEKQLLTAEDKARGVSISFNLEGLLRGDSQGRATFYQTMTQIGAMTINEVRAHENLPPVPGGDVPRMQSQNVPIDTVPSLEDNADADQEEEDAA